MKKNKKVEIFCEVLGYIAYVFLTMMMVAFFLVGAAIFLSGDFTIADIFGMVGCFGSGLMIHGILKG